jgi:hypothetical protein
MALRWPSALAKRGLAVIGGLARGIDAIAHEGSTSVGGRAIGVLGTGVDICYPKENKKLYEKVLERSVILSELPTGSHPAPENFPVRNRIIAGMPLGVMNRRGQGTKRLPDYRPAGHGVWTGGIRCPRQRDRRSQLCPKPVDQAGS